jgi:hypothetical protein
MDDELTPAPRPRLALWLVGLLAVVVNFPLVNNLLIARNIERSGVDVAAELVDDARSGEGTGSEYGLAFRFDETVDPAQSIWTAEVDRATFQRSVESGTVAVRVLPGRPSAYRVDGEVPSRLGWYVTGVADAVLVGAVVVLRRRRAAEADAPDAAVDPPAPAPAASPAASPAAAPAAESLLRLEALEDVHQHFPGFGPPAAFEELGSATYLVTGEVARIAPDAVVLDTGSRRVQVALGSHTNRVSLQQPGQVLARVPYGPPGALPE